MIDTKDGDKISLIAWINRHKEVVAASAECGGERFDMSGEHFATIYEAEPLFSLDVVDLHGIKVGRWQAANRRQNGKGGSSGSSSHASGGGAG